MQKTRLLFLCCLLFTLQLSVPAQESADVDRINKKIALDEIFFCNGAIIITVYLLEKMWVKSREHTRILIYEKIELYGDIFKSLNYVITDTYMGDSNGNAIETKIVLSQDDKKSHFDWCWEKMIENCAIS